MGIERSAYGDTSWKKVQYDLKQSPRAWFERFHKAMISFGYKQTNTDHTIFIKHTNGKITVLIVYVDDIIIIGNNVAEVSELKNKLPYEFKMKVSPYAIFWDMK